MTMFDFLSREPCDRLTCLVQTYDFAFGRKTQHHTVKRINGGVERLGTLGQNGFGTLTGDSRT